MPWWGWAGLVGVAYLWGRQARKASAEEGAADSSVGQALADVGGGAVGIFGGLRDAFGGPIKTASLWQADHSGERNGPRSSFGR